VCEYPVHQPKRAVPPQLLNQRRPQRALARHITRAAAARRARRLGVDLRLAAAVE
jgi:hypothetical protein